MNISVEGNGNNIAGRDLVFNQDRPFQDRLLEELTLKRNLKYANWKKYSDQLDATKRRPALSHKMGAVFMLCIANFIFFVSAWSYSSSAKPSSTWVAVEAFSNSSLMPSSTVSIAGIVIFLVLNLGFLSYISKSSDRKERAVNQLKSVMAPLAKEINDLDTEIEALIEIQRDIR
ncbi:hypothetical protein [Thalassolituus sp.]|uniref:hypothetical protein n=1 Tax=Thalassolituus sp. TaxID=2030822 RepID=UPI003512F8E8